MILNYCVKSDKPKPRKRKYNENEIEKIDRQEEFVKLKEPISENTDIEKHQPSEEEKYSKKNYSLKNNQNDVKTRAPRRVYNDFPKYETNENFKSIKKIKLSELQCEDRNEKLVNSISIDKCGLISDRMKASLTGLMSFEFLTWIQHNSIPPIKSGRNTLIKSPSGTGKTLSYAIPLIDILANLPVQITRKDGLFVLIIVPTKELAKQTLDVIQKVLKKFIWIQAGGIYGCDKRHAEKMRLRKGLNILVSTPGRLHDHLINTKSLDLSKLRAFVMDEADMLLELGYENKISEILHEMSSRYKSLNSSMYQTIMLSATLNQRVEHLSSIALHDPMFIDATVTQGMSMAQEILSTNSQLEQTIILVPIRWRLIALIWFLHYVRKLKEDSRSSKVIVFVGCIYSVTYHSQLLHEIFDAYRKKMIEWSEIEIYQLHGSMEIKERMSIYEKFCLSKDGILITTDVAARGLDFPEVEWVIQYNPARNPIEYVHRVGRTARKGNKGYAVLFLAPHEIEYLDILKESGMNIAKQLELKDLAEYWFASKNHQDLKNSTKLQVEEEASLIHSSINTLLQGSSRLKILASKCFTASVKSYASYPHNLRKYFNPKVLNISHLAESLGLSEAPTDINKMSRDGVLSNAMPSYRKGVQFKRPLTLDVAKSEPVLKKKFSSSKPSALSVSEFTSSISSGPKTRKSKK